METVFLVMFLTGLALSTLSFLLGGAHAHLHLPHVHLPLGHVHVPFVTHAHPGALHVRGGGTAPDGGAMSALNVSTITAFVTWFGGAGYLLSSLGTLPAALILLAAAASGVVGASIVSYALVRVLLPGQTAPMRPEDYRLEGTVARVSVPVGGGRTGEVIYTRHGKTCSEGARSEDGTELPRGTEVVILGYERGIAHVAALDKLLEERPFTVEPLPPRGETSDGR